MGTEGSGASRGGGDEFHNEDAFLVEEGLGLYMVCDGASGSPAGEIASHLAVEAVEQFVARAELEFGPDLWRNEAPTATVERALRYAMAALLEAAGSDPELASMETTATMLLAHGTHGVIGHTGDSRAYLFRGRSCHQLTVDHELTELLPDSAQVQVPIDAFSIALRPRDTLILCTDGAERVVQDPTILRVAHDLSPALLASRIVSAAQRDDPEVDATAVAIRVRSAGEPGWLSLSQSPRDVSFGHALSYA
jgi:serine/threonine protein phosphatase PrpC